MGVKSRRCKPPCHLVVTPARRGALADLRLSTRTHRAWPLHAAPHHPSPKESHHVQGGRRAPRERLEHHVERLARAGVADARPVLGLLEPGEERAISAGQPTHPEARQAQRLRRHVEADASLGGVHRGQQGPGGVGLQPAVDLVAEQHQVALVAQRRQPSPPLSVRVRVRVKLRHNVLGRARCVLDLTTFHGVHGPNSKRRPGGQARALLLGLGRRAPLRASAARVPEPRTLCLAPRGCCSVPRRSFATSLSPR